MRFKCKNCEDIVVSSPHIWKMNWCSCTSIGVDSHRPNDKTCRVVGWPNFIYLGDEEE